MPPAAANLIAGRWLPTPGDAVRSFNPARPSECVWSGAPPLAHVAEAVGAARAAASAWTAWPLERRAAVLREFAALAAANTDALTTILRTETGKPTWDARAEVQLLAAKVDVTLAEGAHAPLARVRGYELPLTASRRGSCWFRPHGVMAVVGPFNFPLHLPNGHIVPALLMGNTVVFKPSDKAPASGAALADLFHRALTNAGAPPGVFNLVQGGADVAAALTSHADIDGVLFTGSWPVGRRIMEANLDRPGRILALEMGGNNAAVVLPDADPAHGVTEIVRAAFISAGQRCTCTRRLIIHRDIAPMLIPAIIKATQALKIGDPASADPVFMGPVISEPARRAILDAQSTFERNGGEVLLRATDLGFARSVPSEGWYLSPGIMRVPRFTLADGPGRDTEVFGPFLRLSIADSLDDAVAQCNATAFGLAASIFTRDPAAAERFRREARAGCINLNAGTAGASGKLPFGGLGLSGNHRPAGAFSLDYCAYPVAGISDDATAAAPEPGMSFDPAWLHAG